jgi:hypothetical protein
MHMTQMQVQLGCLIVHLLTGPFPDADGLQLGYVMFQGTISKPAVSNVDRCRKEMKRSTSFSPSGLRSEKIDRTLRLFK